jgi:hypothetical protein
MNAMAYPGDSGMAEPGLAAPHPVGIHDLPASIESLFLDAAQANFYNSLPWFRSLADAGFPPATRPRLYVAGETKARAGLVTYAPPPSLKQLGTRHLRSLTNFYSIRYAPLLAEGTPPDAIAAVVDQIVAERPRWDVINLDSLDHDDIVFPSLMQALARHGWPVQSYFYFGNWFENTAGMTASDYFAARPGQLRNTLKRHANKLAKTATATYRIFTTMDDIEDGIALYEQIYAQSWKEPEPYPSFAAALIRATAACGALRLGIMTIDGTPAAAQIWIVWGGKATIFKLAHDQRFVALSPGSLLTRHVMEHVLSEGNVREVDFGRGDDGYKQLWLSQRRERWGLIAFNPTTIRGRVAAMRHLGPPALKKLISGLRARVGVRS